MTLLRRLGDKQGVASLILPYFPAHDIYIEPFFGAGGMFLSKPRARHNFLNDNDEEVFNLYMVVLNDRERLRFELSRMPVHQSLWKYWKTEIPADPVMKAVRFLFYSNFGYMGKDNTLHHSDVDPRSMALEEIERIDLGNCHFTCGDFEAAIRSIVLRDALAWENRAFTYCDPPYLGQQHNYEKGDAWNEGELSRLLDVLEWRGYKYAVSEFDNQVVLEMARSRGLHVTVIGERQNMKNRRTEILVTNYRPPREMGVQGSLF